MGISFDYATHIISITSPQVEIGMQELANAISDEEATIIGMNYPANALDGIAEIAGKFEKRPSVFSEIIVKLHPPWQVQFWSGSGISVVSGGSLLGGLGDVPVKATGGAGDITSFSQAVEGTLVVTTTSGLTAEEAANIQRALDLAEADEEWTPTSVIKRHKVTKEILQVKTVTAPGSTVNVTIEEA